MRIAVVDVGSNTVRLLVAATGAGGLAPLHEEKATLLLGEEVEQHGRIRPKKIEQAAGVLARYARIARELRASRLDVIVTAPGRQSENADELLYALTAAAGTPARVVSADEEGRLAYLGAVAAADALPETVAVCDVGGGSTEIVVGTLSAGPAWARSLELGAVRLTRRFFADDPPRSPAIARAAEEVLRELDGVVPPPARAALVAGGTARALRKLVGLRLGPDELATALRLASEAPSRILAKEYGFDRSRARTLAAGALILTGVQQRLVVPMYVARGGLREGAALELLAEDRAA
ncbi:MAG TPA: hypothetical protein VH306_02865 [Gaiellaceae bacterium]|jgi:exopolyphosphatase/guanosine-5'-triphosphate,3'-diphosphate pyrophosphatase